MNSKNRDQKSCLSKRSKNIDKKTKKVTSNSLNEVILIFMREKKSVNFMMKAFIDSFDKIKVYTQKLFQVNSNLQ